MSALDAVFPPRCAGCGELLVASTALCAPCRRTLLPPPDPACVRCGDALDARGTCARCRAEPPPFARVHTAFAFAGAIADAIHRFKYEDRPFLAEPLVELALPELRDALAGCDVIAPVPLHVHRLRDRGFDQAVLLADALARSVQVPLERRLVERVRDTERQVGFGKALRSENLAGAFVAAPDAGRFRTVALVDDVVTTTATVRAAAQALKDRGVPEVRVLALARAI